MSFKKGWIAEMQATEKFFNTSTSCLTEENSTFAPKDMLYSVAGHVSHSAQSIDWFVEGAFSPNGFDMNFEEHIRQARAVTSLDQARESLKRAFANVVKTLEEKSEEEWLAPIAEGPIMGGQPRYAIISAIIDHTAHHRGALTVYSRLLGKEPIMPYA